MAWYDDVHTTKKFRLGTEKTSVAGKTYVYLKGVTSCADGSWVSIAASHVAVLAVADAQGKIAVANGAVDAATKYGWFTVDGEETALCLASFDGTNGAGVYLTATAGSVDDADVAGDAVIGAIGLTDRDTTTGMANFQLNRPFCVDHAID